MKPIRMSKHAHEQCTEHGTTVDEIYHAVQHGSREPAKQGRELCRFNFPFDGMWQGTRYAIKQVAPVIKEETDQIMVITVIYLLFLGAKHEN